MVAVGLALATALIWGAVDFVAGVKSRSSGALAVIALSQPVGLVLIAVLTAARGSRPPTGLICSTRRRPARRAWSASRPSTRASPSG